MRTINLSLSLSLLLVLAGCRFGPNYARPAVNAPGGYRGQAPAQDVSSNVQSNRAPSSSVQLGEAQKSLGDEKWWNVFQDEQLQSMIRTALKNNYDVRIAAQRKLSSALLTPISCHR
jgi:multidrug efflux system outer membrane protein